MLFPASHLLRVPTTREGSQRPRVTGKNLSSMHNFLRSKLFPSKNRKTNTRGNSCLCIVKRACLKNGPDRPSPLAPRPPPTCGRQPGGWVVTQNSHSPANHQGVVVRHGGRGYRWLDPFHFPGERVFWKPTGPSSNPPPRPRGGGPSVQPNPSTSLPSGHRFLRLDRFLALRALVQMGRIGNGSPAPSFRPPGRRDMLAGNAPPPLHKARQSTSDDDPPPPVLWREGGRRT